MNRATGYCRGWDRALSARVQDYYQLQSSSTDCHLHVFSSSSWAEKWINPSEWVSDLGNVKPITNRCCCGIEGPNTHSHIRQKIETRDSQTILLLLALQRHLSLHLLRLIPKRGPQIVNLATEKVRWIDKRYEELRPTHQRGQGMKRLMVPN